MILKFKVNKTVINSKLKWPKFGEAYNTTYVVPIVDSSNKYIVGALIIHVATITSFEIKLLKDYLEYEQNKEDFIKSMIALDFKTFGYKYYEIKDSSLFDGHKGIELKGMPGNTGNNPCDLYEIVTIDENGVEHGTGTWQTVGYCPSILIYFIPGGTAGGSGSYTLPDLTGLITGIGVTPPYTPYPFSLTQMVDYLNEQLLLATDEKEWLMEHEIRAREMFEYLYGHYTPERAVIDREHLQYMISEPEYLGFVVNHRNIYPGTINMWWENEDFIENPNYFSLDIDGNVNQGYELTAEEKVLIGLFPIQAHVISKNVEPATTTAVQMVPASPLLHPGLNDKQDAFRHAYFQALNTRDVPPRILPPISSSTIVRNFADAHESEVPSQLILEKIMDQYNNEEGIIECASCYPGTITDDQIATNILNWLLLGVLRYLSPLNHADPYWYTGPDGTKATATNGITSATLLVPTNQ